MNALEAVKKVQENFLPVCKVPVDGIKGIFRGDEGWVVMLEGLERKAIPDSMDLLGLYEVRLDEAGNLIGFERKRLRKRGDADG